MLQTSDRSANSQTQASKSFPLGHPQMSWVFRRRSNKREVDETIFLRNGRILLEELITSGLGKPNPIRSFSAEELNLATNNYDQERVITMKCQFRLYKGFLKRPVIVMKYVDDRKLTSLDKLCFNNIVFASQVNHKNVLKLIGCCLETEIPILVFESVEYCTLDDWIHSPHQHQLEPLLLRHRLKIAMEIANAMAYLHFGLPKPIVFRDLKPSLILLDEHYVPRLYDFSLSESIPEGETHIKHNIMSGTLGFLAPEYASTGEYNEKCDVYSFGSLLFVLLTGRKTHNQSYREQENAYLEEENAYTKADSVEEDDSTKADNVKADDSIQAVSVEDDYCSTTDNDEEDDRIISAFPFLKQLDISYILKKRIDNNTFNEIIDPIIVGEASFPEMQQQLQDFIQLICKCVNRSAEDRPTMIDAAKQLRQIYLSVV